MILKARDRKLDLSSGCRIMGILNVTPDSFSDGGKNLQTTKALASCREMIEQGADIIDVGGESTRPGYIPVDVDEETRRILPVISGISESLDTIISVDTYKSEVAGKALENGCHMVNDIYGLMYDPNMASVIREYDAAVVLMFNCRRNGECIRESITERAIRELSGSIDRAVKAGIPEDHIVLDPGVGFGTSRSQDAELLASAGRLSFGGRFPVLTACSRKRIAADLLSRQTIPEERDEVSIGIALKSVSLGSRILRVHNVRATRDALTGFEGI
ncbi:MAG: dihydropteroate synthase [Clostridiales bacterium]|nr:dihydropteroate synthase [Clostridiales bacterium]